MQANSGDPDQTPRVSASDLDLHCLPLSHKKDARITWVKGMHGAKCTEYETCANCKGFIFCTFPTSLYQIKTITFISS